MRTLEAKPHTFAPPSARGPVRMPDQGFTRGIGSSGPLPPLVLVIDDHDDSRTICRLVLESAGFRVAEAQTGFDGIRIAIETRPLVVLLDMVLPGLDGWEIARLLRLDPSTREAVIIAVTALAGAEDQDRALLAGCDEVLTKPIPPTVMLDTVRRYVGIPVPAAGRSC
ncbi:MAG TPA: response regulator [Gemmatimonadaceae bacterium]